MKSRIEKFIDTLDDNDTIESINEKARNVFFEAEKEKLGYSVQAAIKKFNQKTGIYVSNIFFDVEKNDIEIEYFEIKPKPKCRKNGEPISFDEAKELLRKALSRESICR